jgi:DNA/RNA endonuclease YhcR with UshA esterase domain
LNIGKDFPDESRFTVFISGGDDTPEDAYSGKTVTVTGEVQMYRNVPEIKVSAKDVVVK